MKDTSQNESFFGWRKDIFFVVRCCRILCETVSYRDNPYPKKIDKLSPYYEKGIYLGVHHVWDVHIVYDPRLKKAVTSSCLNDLTEDNRWGK